MRFRRSIAVFITIILLSVGCTANPPPKGVDDFPYDLMVNIVDLTNKFEYFSSEFPKIDGAFTYSITYVNKSKMIGSNFSHWVSIYSDSKSANEAYSSWETRWFNEHWTYPSDSTYKPKNSEDIYQIACMDVKINELPTRSCELLQLHNNLIILVLTNINSDNIDFRTFEEILTQLDARLPTEDIPVPGR
jgi:hypothetical protein